MDPRRAVGSESGDSTDSRDGTLAPELRKEHNKDLLPGLRNPKSDDLKKLDDYGLRPMCCLRCGEGCLLSVKEIADLAGAGYYCVDCCAASGSGVKGGVSNRRDGNVEGKKIERRTTVDKVAGDGKKVGTGKKEKREGGGKKKMDGAGKMRRLWGSGSSVERSAVGEEQGGMTSEEALLWVASQRALE